MKFAIVLVFCLVGLASTGKISRPKHHKYTQQELLENLSKYLNKKIELQDGQEPLIDLGSILPDVPDPLQIGDFSFSFGPGNPDGTVSLSGLVLTGGSSINDNLNIDIEVDPKLTLTIDITRLRLDGRIFADIFFALEPPLEFDFNADGSFYVELNGLRANLVLVVEIFGDFFPGQFRILSADLNWSLDVLDIFAENTIVNGAELEWPVFVPIVRQIIDDLWIDNKPQVDELLKTVLGQVTESCNAFELATGDSSCINLPFSFDGEDIPADVNEYLIQSERVTNYGSFGNLARCPTGTFAHGFSLKNEGEQGAEDDTSLNSVRLYCGPDSSAQQIESAIGDFGEYGNPVFCDEGGYINGFQLRSEDDGQLDNTAANNFRAYCSSNALVAKQGNANQYGKWRKVLKCAGGFGACGIQTQVEGEQGFFDDDTALNNVDILCCRR